MVCYVVDVVIDFWGIALQTLKKIIQRKSTNSRSAETLGVWCTTKLSFLVGANL